MKKGMSEIWWVLATAVIVLVVVILVLVFFKTGSGKLFGGIEEQISWLEDCDKDNVADFYDKCPCNPAIQDVFPAGITECGTGIQCGKKCPGK